MPGLETDAEQVVFWVSEIDIPQVLEFLEHVRGGETLREVINAESRLPDIKITNAMKGAAGWSKRTGRS